AAYFAPLRARLGRQVSWRLVLEAIPFAQRDLCFLALFQGYRPAGDGLFREGPRTALPAPRPAVELPLILASEPRGPHKALAVGRHGGVVMAEPPAELNDANLGKRLAINGPCDARRGRHPDDEGIAVFLRKRFEVVHPAVGDALAPVD